MLSPVKNTPNKDQPVAALDLGGGGMDQPPYSEGVEWVCVGSGGSSMVGGTGTSGG